MRGCPFLSKLRTGAAKSWRGGEAHEGEDEGAGHGEREGGKRPRPTREEPGSTGNAPPAEPKA